MKKKKLIIFLFLVIVIIVTVIFIIIGSNQNKAYSYKWEIEKNSVINQQRLYVVNKKGKPTSGYVRVTYLKGNSKKIKIEKEGKIFVKSVVKDVKVIIRR